MLSGLSRTWADGFREAPISACAPPRRFRSAEGAVDARREISGPFAAPSLRGKTSAQKIGIRYERKVLKELGAIHGPEFSPSQWFSYRVPNDTARRWCQVDGFLSTSSGITLFEVKSRFSSDAWYQLRRLYEPVVRGVFPTVPLRLVVVCRSFDPWTPFPEAYTLIESFDNLVDHSINVLPWRA